jgi:hypothetical protein
MASYLILTPPQATGGNVEETRFVRDGFSLTAFVFPVLWLAFHRLWFYAIAAFLVQAIGLEMLSVRGFGFAGAALILSTHILTALEGNHLFFAGLSSRGWRREGLLSAPNLGTAEEIYFSNIEPDQAQDIPSAKWDISQAGSRSRDAAFGLPGYDGGR